MVVGHFWWETAKTSDGYVDGFPLCFLNGLTEGVKKKRYIMHFRSTETMWCLSKDKLRNWYICLSSRGSSVDLFQLWIDVTGVMSVVELLFNCRHKASTYSEGI